ncbi:DNA-directed RNA polymerase specialized sigma24 family protein [Novosphingobium hassiacum]|uniref:DNA-directed RNA polymerase specialized sigma24 family protein n=1 Tax=Novosphingobium hassiacum TaxID=173676 RepID=A0A7W6EWD6_9SPHN|nr:hypothetical protein [Novosphingobium hassiacum]MBB3860885.1 DNA-directed RNA polymerase specialized sigma24 family protein [Novosphingobium hassiacum]
MFPFDLSQFLDRLLLVGHLRRRRRLHAMRIALNSLPTFHQTVFRLIRFEGLSSTAAAEQLGVSLLQVEDALADVLVALVEANRW